MGKIRQAFINTLLPILVYGAAIGSIVGVVVFGYSFASEWITEQSQSIYKLVGQNLQFLPLIVVGSAVLAILTWLLVKALPEVKGSGIPYTEGVMRGLLSFKWWKMMLATIFGSFISFFAGLPLGVEGPSVLVGGTLGQGINEVTSPLCKKSAAWKRMSITGGASAAIATVFKAPLTGIVFALEEGHRRFSPMIFLTAASSILFACFVSGLLGRATGAEIYFFNVEAVDNVSWLQLWAVPVVGVICGLAAAFFSLVLYKSTDFFRSHKKIPKLVYLLAVFILVGIVGVFLIEATTGGYGVIDSVMKMDFSWQMLLLIAFVRLILTVFCVNTVAVGGLFMPMLAMGALIGGLLGHMLISLGIPQSYYSFIVIISMCSFLGAVIRAPLTAIILTVEITGQFSGSLLYAAIAVVIAYFIVELFHIAPFYDYQLDAIVKQTNKGKRKEFCTFETVVEKGSFAAGKNVRDILWPANTIVLKIQTVDKSGKEKIRMDKDGDRMIKVGDRYTIKADTYDAEKTQNEVFYLVKNPKNYPKKDEAKEETAKK